MNKIAVLQRLNKRGRTLVVVAVALLTAGFSFGPAAGSAFAVTCRNVVNPAEAFRYDPGSQYNYLVAASNVYTVPGSGTSGCVDINVKNITLNAAVTDPHCNYFRVHFYPSSGGDYSNAWQWRCSTPPNGSVVAIATNVSNGTRYAVEYQTRYNFPPLSYTIRD